MNFCKFQDRDRTQKGRSGKTKTLPSAGRNLEHCGRQPNDRVRGNEKIDPTLTACNYDLAEELREGKSGLMYYRSKLTEAKDKYRYDHNGQEMRKDTVTLCSWVVTAPKDLDEKKVDDFFEESYKWLSDIYGKENVIMAACHFDETTPHMHFCFMPFVEDEKYGGLKLRAKNLETQATLRQKQVDLQKYLTEQLGCEVNLLNGSTEGGNKTIEQLKTETLKKQNEELKAQNEEIIAAKETAEMQVKQALSEFEEIQHKTAAAFANMAGDNIRPAPEPPVAPNKMRLPELDIYLKSREGRLVNEKNKPLKGRKREEKVNELVAEYNDYMQDWFQYDRDMEKYNSDYSEWLSEVEKLGLIDGAVEYNREQKVAIEQERKELNAEKQAFEEEKSDFKRDKEAFEAEKKDFKRQVGETVTEQLWRSKLARELSAPSNSYIEKMRQIGVTVDENGLTAPENRSVERETRSNKSKSLQR